MKKDRAENVSAYDRRFRHKLDMLEPGSSMLRWMGLLLLAGAVLRLLGLTVPAYRVWGLAGAVFGVLAVLLIIESHQDRVLNELAAEENREREKNGDVF